MSKTKCYICSNDGFFVDIKFDLVDEIYNISWSTKISEAKRLNSKTARNIINKGIVKGFIWKPYEQTPIKDRYRVMRKYDNEYNFSVDDEFIGFVPEKVTMEHDTDVNVLLADGKSKKDYYYTLDEVIKICNERNAKLVNNVNNLIDNTNKNIKKVE